MLRQPLGRGLDALIANTAPAAANPAPPLLFVPVGQIAPCPFQPRSHFDEDRLSELAAAIKSQGVIEPLIVRQSHRANSGAPPYELIAGDRRLRAARMVGLERVPVVVRELDDRAGLEMALVENLAREDLDPIDEGIALKRLHIDLGQSHDQIAERIGKSRPYVSNAIRLTDLPQPVLDLIHEGRLSAGQARPLLTLGSADAQIAAARGIVERGATARAVEAIASAHRKQRKSNGHQRPGLEDANLNALVETLQRTLKRKVRIVQRRGKTPGRIELEYYDDNDLTVLADRLMDRSSGASAMA
jgi:ParB family chromosome partitioning protein